MALECSFPNANIRYEFDWLDSVISIVLPMARAATETSSFLSFASVESKLQHTDLCVCEMLLVRTEYVFCPLVLQVECSVHY